MKLSMNLLRIGIALCALAAPRLFAAGITVSLTPAVAAAGSTGNAFDVDLTNLGSAPVIVGGFSFELTVANSNISFNDVTTATTATYVFNGKSTFGPDLSGPSMGQLIDASDVYNIATMGITINPGVTFGLGHVIFSVSSNASPGVFPVNLTAFPMTTLSDAAGNDLAINTLSPGQITIPGSAVPETSSLLLVLLGAAALLVLRVFHLEGKPKCEAEIP